jgi:arylsulfatase A-like enzyme
MLPGSFEKIGTERFRRPMYLVDVDFSSDLLGRPKRVISTRRQLMQLLRRQQQVFRRRQVPWRKFFRAMTIVLFLFEVAYGVAVAAEGRPNILLIVSDDQGYNDLGCLGNGIQTPTLDRLCREGTRLTNFYVAWPACTPSRGALLTGRYPQRNGLYDMIRNEAPDYGKRYDQAEYEVTFERIIGMDTREVLVAQLLKQAGYRTAVFGKWDGGSHRRFLPTSRGFDEFYGFVNTGIDYYTHERYGVPSMYRNDSLTEEDKGIYSTLLFEREAHRFVEQCLDKPSQPFFLYLPFNAPHGSSSLDPQIRSSVQAPEAFREVYPPVAKETRLIEKYRYGGAATVVTPEARQRDYRAAVTCMDASIGKVLNRLESRGALANTIVIFFSDNGGSGGADNKPLRGHKGQVWEGGIRVPCVIRWPQGKVPAGLVNDAFLTSLEIFPSLLAAAGITPPPGLKLDGYDWWSTLSQAQPSPRTEMFWQRRDDLAARVGDWKFVRQGSTTQLFNLADDVGESSDLSTQEHAQLAAMEAAIAAWQVRMEAAPVRGPFRNH